MQGFVFPLLAIHLQLSLGAVQQLQTPKQQPKQDGVVAPPPLPHFEPMVAVYCPPGPPEVSADVIGQPSPYLHRFMSPGGQWQTDRGRVAGSAGPTCPLRNKVAVLELCKKAYPDRDITNIVEAGHFIKLTGWCRRDDSGRCDTAATAQWVKPFRCLEGPFQSDALLVPEHCLFDHVHNQSRCATFDAWNVTATDACRSRAMGLKSFGMLLPCGIDVFSGVEFVCCPRSASGGAQRFTPVRNPNALAIDSAEKTKAGKDGSEEEYYLDEEDAYFEDETKDEDKEDDEDDYVKEEYVETTSSTEASSTTSSTTTKAEVETTRGAVFERIPMDPYFSLTDPAREHAEFIQVFCFLLKTRYL
jgi:amyloid beta A4 protein